MTKVLIGVPCGDRVMTLTMQSIVGLVMHSATRPDLETAFIPWLSSVPAQAQNELARATLAGGFDALLLIDSDMVIPADALCRLLDHDLPIVGAVYRRRQPPHPILARPAGDADHLPATGLAEVVFIGTGCLLIRRAVLDAIPYPHFAEDWGDAPGALVSQDIAFCRKARAAGFRVSADMDLSRRVYHVAAIPLGMG